MQLTYSAYQAVKAYNKKSIFFAWYLYAKGPDIGESRVKPTMQSNIKKTLKQSSNPRLSR
jgi:hypothetical protein